MEKSMTYEEYENNNRIVVTTKIVTYEGMYYTLNKHPKFQIDRILEERKDSDIKETEEDIINELITEDLCNIINSKDDLIWLPYENKIINKKEIKESLIQFN